MTLPTLAPVLRCRTSSNSTRLIRLISGNSRLIALDCRGNLVPGVMLDSLVPPTPEEIAAFEFEERVAELADDVKNHGATHRVCRWLIKKFEGRERDDLICSAADLLRERGQDGRASQLLAFRFEEPAQVSA